MLVGVRFTANATENEAAAAACKAEVLGEVPGVELGLTALCRIPCSSSSAAAAGYTHRVGWNAAVAKLLERERTLPLDEADGMPPPPPPPPPLLPLPSSC